MLGHIPVESLLVAGVIANAISVRRRAIEAGALEAAGGEQFGNVTPHIGFVGIDQIRANDRADLVGYRGTDLRSDRGAAISRRRSGFPSKPMSYAAFT